MRNLVILSDAVSYIEAHLKGEISQAGIAAHCCCSLSGLQKLFRYAFHISVGDYITRRRLTCCARELISGERTALDVALDYGYQSAEAFTRAFTRVWGETPSAFRRSRRFSGLFPPFDVNETGGDDMREYQRKYDISELYDLLKARRGRYILAFDIQNLMGINALSGKAGDAAIRESLRRIDEAADEDMVLFRVGGDEFALLTNLEDEAAADAVARRVTDRNGEAIEWEGRRIPLGLYSAKLRIGEGALRYDELFPEIKQTLDGAKP